MCRPHALELCLGFVQRSVKFACGGVILGIDAQGQLYGSESALEWRCDSVGVAVGVAVHGWCKGLLGVLNRVGCDPSEASDRNSAQAFIESRTEMRMLRNELGHICSSPVQNGRVCVRTDVRRPRSSVEKGDLTYNVASGHGGDDCGGARSGIDDCETARFDDE
ncbi:MAG: hypothetical protein ACJARS_001605 [bacterium]